MAKAITAERIEQHWIKECTVENWIDLDGGLEIWGNAEEAEEPEEPFTLGLTEEARKAVREALTTTARASVVYKTENGTSGIITFDGSEEITVDIWYEEYPGNWENEGEEPSYSSIEGSYDIETDEIAPY